MGLSPSGEAAQLYSYSRRSQYFMKLGTSLPRSQQLCSGLYPEPNQQINLSISVAILQGISVTSFKNYIHSEDIQQVGTEMRIK
jgi:hypothetical protein